MDGLQKFKQNGIKCGLKKGESEVKNLISTILDFIVKSGVT